LLFAAWLLNSSFRFFEEESFMEMQPAADRPPDQIHFIFFNDRGLRAGWRLAIFIGLFLPIGFVSLLLPSLSPKFPPNSPFSVLMGDGAIFVAVAITSWIMSRIEKRDAGSYGLPLRKGAFSNFVMGYIFWGFLTLSLLLLALHVMEVFDFGSIALHGSDILTFGLLWGVAFLMVALFEEYLNRGYLLQTLADGIGFWPAAVVLACLFAFGHSFNRGETRLGILMTAVFAIFACLTLRLTGNLWLAVGAHAGWDWAQTYFYGVPDSGIVATGHLFNSDYHGPEWLSGGSAGPEGSVAVLVLLILMCVLFSMLYRKPETKMISE
jgi:uncharacterized protein